MIGEPLLDGPALIRTFARLHKPRVKYRYWTFGGFTRPQKMRVKLIR